MQARLLGSPLSAHGSRAAICTARASFAPSRLVRRSPRSTIAVAPRAALDVSLADSETLTGLIAAASGIAIGIGLPVFFISRDEIDEERLENLRALNREAFATTGEYLSDEEIAAIRPQRWTDNKEFVDDD